MSEPTELGLDQVDLRQALEAILMVAEEPVPAGSLAAAVGMPEDLVVAALERLRDDYDGVSGQPRRGFELRHVEGKWRVYSRAEWAPWVGKFILGSQTAALSRAAMETLAIIAYRQPITRGQIARIRGVNVDSVLRTLLTRGLIWEDGEAAGGARLLRTTTEFLERMGMEDLSELPPLAPFMPGPENVDYLLAELP